eukprot:CAMPEP_0177227862 /NCGR_PEP_ID=MMETSP0367-20130122/40842_1 /TAXON_ID=447022 ORGANISM="Scrippsiella hangoei-like, Strain SHHI-4" /NCGR_SAMPLE_ID=MMETSP0367 /ASSEMBLY_ACC=CAM_ASM_000362 /LENGTH=39 /DNA_ID= /DNA_START= /DNA_END= /DNA_ORIENTATION=
MRQISQLPLPPGAVAGRPWIRQARLAAATVGAAAAAAAT